MRSPFTCSSLDLPTHAQVCGVKAPATASQFLQPLPVSPVLNVTTPTYPFSSAVVVLLPAVDVTLNPDTANLNLVLSRNRRQVRFVGAKASEPSCPEEHYDCSVLGMQYFSSGRHYWEVDVAKKTTWFLGVCSNSVGPTSSSKQYAKHPNTYSRYQPQSGYWVIGLQHKHVYRAYEDSTAALLLSMTVRPRRIGVFLDYEAGTVSFYNVTNHGFPIYTFSKYYFPTTLCPYFNPCDCVVPMTLRGPSF
ncbi:tripartite motif-containing protein 6 [Lemur catta]|uniref:tripartite motif-containing protein 6 n=1 Tax=Lemur catta TaxID=9447 RepID=UPI001E26D49A|nr:tripartite motif-containing protein 6 [Lemur catta]